MKAISGLLVRIITQQTTTSTARRLASHTPSAFPTLITSVPIHPPDTASYISSDSAICVCL